MQARARAHAEARLRAEEGRFAALTGAGGWSSSGSSPYSVSARDRCAIAKAERDAAYRLVGNDRNYDFIRHWNDVVYEACKDT